MTPDEHSAFAREIEDRLRRDFAELECAVRPHVDTYSSEPIELLIFEVRATTPPIQIAYTIIGDEEYEVPEVESLAAHIGTLLSQRLRSYRR